MATTMEVLTSANEVLAAHSSLIHRVRAAQRDRRRTLRSLPSPPTALLDLPLIRTPPASPPLSPASEAQFKQILPPRPLRNDIPPQKRARAARYRNYVPEEETIRNDYSQRYVDGGEWPQNWVIGSEMERRFEEYPKQQRLLEMKKQAVSETAHPALYISLPHLRALLPQKDKESPTTTTSPSLPVPPPTASSSSSTPTVSAPQTLASSLPSTPSINLNTSPQPPPSALKFDVILIDPPFSSSFTWEALEAFPIAQIAADPSFIFLWVGSGSGDGLERGREVLGKWGYRRCEDICWVKTNETTNAGPGTDPPTTSLLTRTKQHCLMGIRGTVRRSSDSWFVHCNIDTDVIIWPGDPCDPTRKPPEMYQLIENFCLGTRRLELFGRLHSLRRGWVTCTADELQLTPAEARLHDLAREFDRDEWEKIEKAVKDASGSGRCVVPQTPEIESLRPKSPTPRGHNQSNSGSGPMLGMTGPNANNNPNVPSGALGLPQNPQSQMNMNMNMGMGMGRPNQQQRFNNNNNNNRMNAQPMGMMMGQDGGMVGGTGLMRPPPHMQNMGGMGNNMNSMNMGVMGMQPMGTGLGMQNMNMGNMNMGMNNSNMGMQGFGGSGGGMGGGFNDGSGNGMMMMNGPNGMPMPMGMHPGAMGPAMFMGGMGDGGGVFDGMPMNMNMGGMGMPDTGGQYMNQQMMWPGPGNGGGMGGMGNMGGMGMGQPGWRGGYQG